MARNKRFCCIYLPMALISLTILVIAIPTVTTQASPPDDQLPVPYFLDDRKEVTYELRELAEGLEVQVGVSQAESAVLLTLDVLNFISADGVTQPTESLVAEIVPNQGDPTRGSMTILPGQRKSFHVRFHVDAYERRQVARATYTGILALTANGGETVRKQLNLVVGGIGNASILSSQVFPNVIVCPKWWPMNCHTFVTYHADPERECPPSDYEIHGAYVPFRPFGRCTLMFPVPPGHTYSSGYGIRIQDYHPILTRTARGYAASEHGRAAIFLTGEVVPTRGFDEYVLWIDGLTSSGRYEGSFYLDASHPESSPSAEIVIQARDFGLPPLLTIVLGVLISNWLVWTLGPGRERRLHQKQKRDLQATIMQLQQNIRASQRVFMNESEGCSYATYTIQHFSDLLLTQAQQALDSGDLERVNRLVSEVQETFNTFNTLGGMLQRLHARLQAFEDQESQNNQKAFLRAEPSMVTDIRYSLQGKAIDDLRELRDLHAHTEALLDRFDRFYAIYRRLCIAYELSENLQGRVKGQKKCAELAGQFRASIGESKRLLWVAGTAWELLQADKRLTVSLLSLDELHLNGCIKPDLEPKIDSLRETATLGRVDSRTRVFETAVTTSAQYPTLPKEPKPKAPVGAKLRQRLHGIWQLASSRRDSPVPLLSMILRIAIVVSSGYLLVYLSNPTFGSIGDYLLALLWGSTSDAALKAISALSQEGALTTISNLLKR